MLLAIDVGNTNIKFAVFEGEKIVTTFRVSTSSPRSSDDFGLAITSLLRARGCKPAEIEDAIISSVVPDIMYSLSNSLVRFFNIKPLVLGPGTKTGIKLIKTNPAEVGSDRIADGVAALTLYGGPIIVADYGTATKFDYFDEDWAFQSAITCPGIMLSARALWDGTAKLPEIEIKNPGSFMCKDTITSLQAGILYGKIGEAEYIISKIKEEAGKDNIKVVGTGGMAKIIYNESECIDILEPNLTMYGLKAIYEKNRK